MSSPMPASRATEAMKRLRYAFDAYVTSVSACRDVNACTYSWHVARSSASSKT